MGQILLAKIIKTWQASEKTFFVNGSRLTVFQENFAHMLHAVHPQLGAALGQFSAG